MARPTPRAGGVAYRAHLGQLARGMVRITICRSIPAAPTIWSARRSISTTPKVTAWSWTHGRVEMATLMLDPNAFLREFKTDDRSAAASPASVGHVHLSVGDVATAREFYVNRLGFETTAQVGSSALFVSAGGYHHHMAMNSWNTAGAGKRRLALGLGLVRIEVPTDDDLHSLGDRLRHYGLDGRHDGRVLGFDDPWLNRIEVTSKAGG
jgi:catechol 2,3-dioxygenase